MTGHSPNRVYSEISPLFKRQVELTQHGRHNKHAGFSSPWLIMAAWHPFHRLLYGHATFAVEHLGSPSFNNIIMTSSWFYCLYSCWVFGMDAQMLVAAAFFLFAIQQRLSRASSQYVRHWNISNFSNSFQSNVDSTFIIPGLDQWDGASHHTVLRFWDRPANGGRRGLPTRIRRRLSVVPFLTCGNIYTFFFFCVAGLIPDNL